jgi:hypothetical protein
MSNSENTGDVNDGRSRRRTVDTLLVAASIITVALMIVYILQAIPVPHVPSGPRIELAEAVSMGGDQWRVEVTYVGETEHGSLSDFRAVLIRNGTVVALMNPLQPGTSGEIDFTDGGSQGELDAGDDFVLTCWPAGRYELALIDSYSGNVMAEAEWST